jgi:hypothetical protein
VLLVDAELDGYPSQTAVTFEEELTFLQRW